MAMWSSFGRHGYWIKKRKLLDQRIGVLVTTISRSFTSFLAIAATLLVGTLCSPQNATAAYLSKSYNIPGLGTIYTTGSSKNNIEAQLGLELVTPNYSVTGVNSYINDDGGGARIHLGITAIKFDDGHRELESLYSQDHLRWAGMEAYSYADIDNVYYDHSGQLMSTGYVSMNVSPFDLNNFRFDLDSDYYKEGMHYAFLNLSAELDYVGKGLIDPTPMLAGFGTEVSTETVVPEPASLCSLASIGLLGLRRIHRVKK
jgi:hypothetical protein